MRVNVKPLVHWAIYKGYTLRFQTRTSQRATGILTRPDGQVAFAYDSGARTIQITALEPVHGAQSTSAAVSPDPEPLVHINEYGWEVQS